MYKIIGGDGREYGPVDAAQIQQWVSEGRADRFTRVQPEGGEWIALSEIPEFAHVLAQRSQSVPPPPLAYASPVDFQQSILQREARLDIGDCLSRGWSLFTGNFGLFFGAVLILWVIQQVVFIPILGTLVFMVVGGPLYGGLSLIYLKRIRGEPVGVGDIFSAFGPNFLPLMLVGILVGLLSSLGYVFCVLPGLYLQVAWVFAIALVADKNLNFWDAMELSRRVVTRKWFLVFVLMLLAFLPVILFKGYLNYEGIMAFWPLFQEMANGGELNEAKMNEVGMALTVMEFKRQIVLLIILPFGSAVLMQAYEALFGSRKTPGA